MSAILHTLAEEPTSPAPRTRRVSRHKEDDRTIILRSVPKGSVRAAHGSDVLRALAEHPEFAQKYASAQLTLRSILCGLISRTNYETMTSRPGWKYLGEAIGVSRRTVARALKTLEAWGLLGVVASGRSAKWATVGPDGQRSNEAAVYVLCTPSPLALVEEPETPIVDKDGTPPAVGGSHLNIIKETHTRARGNSLEGTATPSEGTTRGSATTDHQMPYRPELNWPAHRTAASKKQRLCAASELRHRIFLLRPMSQKDVASVVRDFLLSGWTVADLHHALDFQPDGSPWPYAGVPETDYSPQLRGWMRSRLNAWRTTTGEPLRSRDQRLSIEARQQRAEAAATATRLRKERAQRITKAQQYSPEKMKAIAQIRALKMKTNE